MILKALFADVGESTTFSPSQVCLDPELHSAQDTREYGVALV